VAFAYDAGGRLVEKNFPNGVSARYTYNADNTLAQLVNRHGSGTIVSQHDYTYDTIGNRITHNELINGTTTPYGYVYDPLSRLTQVTNTQTSAVLESYSYDALGNRLSKTDASATTTAFIYDLANQLTEARQGSPTGALTMAFVYDANGGLTKKCEGGTVTGSPTTCSGATVTDLTYDQLNRTSQIAKTGLSTQTYLYDDQGRRIQKTVGGVATNYLYNGPDIHATYSSLWDTPANKFVHGGGIDTPLIRITSTGKQYFHQDGLGSVVALTRATGAVDGSTRYDAWGNAIASTGTVPVYGYTGREPDETGLIYYRARYYDPAVGRFSQRDPIGLSGGLNHYAYVASNPVNAVDPEGLQPVSPVAPQSNGYVPGMTGINSGQQTLAALPNAAENTSGPSLPPLTAADFSLKAAVPQPVDVACGPACVIVIPIILLSTPLAAQTLQTMINDPPDIVGGLQWIHDWWISRAEQGNDATAPERSGSETPPPDSPTRGHHTVPKEILKQLPKEVADDPAVRGRAGAPNVWEIPKEIHDEIHHGAGGGPYNETWKRELQGLGRAPTVEDIKQLREKITKQFGIDRYRP